MIHIAPFICPLADGIHHNTTFIYVRAGCAPRELKGRLIAIYLFIRIIQRIWYIYVPHPVQWGDSSEITNNKCL